MLDRWKQNGTPPILLNQWSRTIYWFTIGIVQPHKIAYKLYMVKSRLVDMWEAWAVCGSMCSLQSVLKGNFFVRTYWEVKVKSVGTYFEEYSATCRHNKTSWISCCLLSEASWLLESSHPPTPTLWHTCCHRGKMRLQWHNVPRPAAVTLLNAAPRATHRRHTWMLSVGGWPQR